MILYLLIVSLLLHFVTFFILIVIVKKMRSAFDYQQFETQKKELEDLLAYYSVELKEENERFLKEILEKTKLQETGTELKETHNVAEEQNTLTEIEEIVQEEKTVETYAQPSLEAQALQLYEQGYDIKEIAKKLNKGHGEIELLLKFHLSK